MKTTIIRIVFSILFALLTIGFSLGSVILLVFGALIFESPIAMAIGLIMLAAAIIVLYGAMEPRAIHDYIERKKTKNSVKNTET